MPGYVSKARQCFQNKMPDKPQCCPYKAPPKVYGASAKEKLPEEKPPALDKKWINLAQQVIGVCLYYSRAIPYMGRHERL